MTMRLLALALLLSAGVTGVRGVASGSHDAVPPSPPEPGTVVVAELFTSEGCSSCPPADDLLRDWLASQPVPGVRIVGLSEHVDYWNRLGWRDPFSSGEFSARQSTYAEAVFRTRGIYTPQIVVDGRFEAIGSDAATIRRAILDAARQSKARLTVTPALRSDRLDVSVHVLIPDGVRPEGVADLVVAVTEDDLATRVTRGENGGRTLRHAAVARALVTIGSVAPTNSDATLHGEVGLAAGWSWSKLRAVAFLQERRSRRIIGAAVADLGATS